MLSTPPAFILSQDQTLQLYLLDKLLKAALNQRKTCSHKLSLFSFQRSNRSPKAANHNARFQALTKKDLYQCPRLLSMSFFAGRHFSEWQPCGQKKPDAVMVLFTASGLTKDFRRRPTLPHSLPCSTIGAEELNFRVRDGNGCDLFAIATEKAV